MNAFKSLADELKPRERMGKLGSARGMRPEELVAILLKTGAPGCNVGETSRRLIGAFHNVRELVLQDWRGLMTRIAAYNKGNHEGRNGDSPWGFSGTVPGNLGTVPGRK